MISEFRPHIDPILGIVRTCPACLEAWPEDEEFYRRRDRGPCRACEWEFAERRRSMVAAAARAYRARLRERA